MAFGGSTTETEVNLGPDVELFQKIQADIAGIQKQNILRQQQFQESLFASGSAATPEQQALIRQARDFALERGESDIQAFEQERLAALREELAPSLGLRSTDTPILDRGSLVARASVRQQGQLVSALGQTEAEQLLTFPLQAAAVTGGLGLQLAEIGPSRIFAEQGDSTTIVNEAFDLEEFGKILESGSQVLKDIFGGEDSVFDKIFGEGGVFGTPASTTININTSATGGSAVGTGGSASAGGGQSTGGFDLGGIIDTIFGGGGNDPIVTDFSGGGSASATGGTGTTTGGTTGDVTQGITQLLSPRDNNTAAADQLEQQQVLELRQQAQAEQIQLQQQSQQQLEALQEKTDAALAANDTEATAVLLQLQQQLLLQRKEQSQAAQTLQREIQALQDRINQLKQQIPPAGSLLS